MNDRCEAASTVTESSTRSPALPRLSRTSPFTARTSSSASRTIAPLPLTAVSIRPAASSSGRTEVPTAPSWRSASLRAAPTVSAAAASSALVFAARLPSRVSVLAAPVSSAANLTGDDILCSLRTSWARLRAGTRRAISCSAARRAASSRRSTAALRKLCTSASANSTAIATVALIATVPKV